MAKEYGKLRNLINLCMWVSEKLPESIWARKFVKHSDDIKLIKELFSEEEEMVISGRKPKEWKTSDYENIMTGHANNATLLKLYSKKLEKKEHLATELLRMEQVIKNNFASDYEIKEFAKLLDEFLGERYGLFFPIVRYEDIKKQKRVLEREERCLQDLINQKKADIEERTSMHLKIYREKERHNEIEAAEYVYEYLTELGMVQGVDSLLDLKQGKAYKENEGKADKDKIKYKKFEDEISKREYTPFVLGGIDTFIRIEYDKLMKTDSKINNNISKIIHIRDKLEVIAKKMISKRDDNEELCFKRIAEREIERNLQKQKLAVNNAKNKLLPYLIVSSYIDDPFEEKKYVIRKIIDITSNDFSSRDIQSYIDFQEKLKEAGSYTVVKKNSEYFILFKHPEQEYTDYLLQFGYVEVRMKRNTLPMSYYRKLYNAAETPIRKAAYGLISLLSANRFEEVFHLLFKKDVYRKIEDLYMQKSYHECANMIYSLSQTVELEDDNRYIYIDYIKAKLVEKGYLQKGRITIEALYRNCFDYIERKEDVLAYSDYFIGAACYELAVRELEKENRSAFVEYINAALKSGYRDIYSFLGDMYYAAYENYKDENNYSTVMLNEILLDNSVELKLLSIDILPVFRLEKIDQNKEDFVKWSIICYFLADSYNSYHKIRRILQTLRKDNGEYADVWYKAAEERLIELSKARGHLVYPDLEGIQYISDESIMEWIEKDYTIGDIDSETDMETYVIYHMGKKTKIFLESLNTSEEKRVIVIETGDNVLPLAESNNLQIVDCTSVTIVGDLILSLKYFGLHRGNPTEDDVCDELDKGKGKYHFIALEDDSELNAKFSKTVMEHIYGYVHAVFRNFDLEKIREKFLDVCDIVVNIEPVTVQMVLDPVQENFGDFFVQTKYISYNSEISKQLLLQQPLFAPQLAVKEKMPEISEVIVLGNDESIPMLVKNIIAVAYIPREVRDYKVRVTVIEDGSGTFRNQLMTECPGLFETDNENRISYIYNVEFTNFSFDSYEFQQTFNMKKSNFVKEQKALREKIDNCRYFVCAMNEDKESIAWGMRIRQWLYQKDAGFDENVSISVLCRNELYAEQVKNIRVGDINVAPMWFADYNLNVYGQERFCFSYGNLYDDFISGIQKAVFEGDRETYDRKSLNYITKGEGVFNVRKNKYYSSWYDRDSADMRNLYLIYRLYSAGVFDGLTKWDYDQFLLKAKGYNKLYLDKLSSFNIMMENLKNSDRQTAQDQIAANKALTKDFLSRNEHYRWVGFMLSRGWQCPVNYDYVESYMDKGNPEYKCAIAKMHPAIRPYEQLGDLQNDENPGNNALMQVKIDQLRMAHKFSISKKSVKRYNAEAIEGSAKWLKYYERHRESNTKEKESIDRRRGQGWKDM